LFILENYRVERLIVDLRDYIEPKDLPRMNSKKGDSNRRIKRLDYDYSVEFEGETPIYFVQFKKPGEDIPTKLKVHTTRIDLARLETHQSLSRDIPSSINGSDVASTDDDSSGCVLEVDESILSSETSSVQVAVPLKREQEQRTAKPALTATSNNQHDISVKRTSMRLTDDFENDLSSPALLQHDSEFSARTQDYSQKIVSQCISNPDPSRPNLRPHKASVTVHKIHPRRLQDGTRHPHEPTFDTTSVAVALNKFDSGPIGVMGDTETSVALTSVNRPCEALTGIPRELQSRAPPQTKTRPPPILRTVAPGQRITRQGIPEALESVSPNLCPRKVMSSGVREKGNATSNVRGRPKDSLLPVPSKRQKIAASTRP
jgi:hypothetical protein